MNAQKVLNPVLMALKWLGGAPYLHRSMDGCTNKKFIAGTIFTVIITVGISITGFDSAIIPAEGMKDIASMIIVLALWGNIACFILSLVLSICNGKTFVMALECVLYADRLVSADYKKFQNVHLTILMYTSIGLLMTTAKFAVEYIYIPATYFSIGPYISSIISGYITLLQNVLFVGLVKILGLLFHTVNKRLGNNFKQQRELATAETGHIITDARCIFEQHTKLLDAVGAVDSAYGSYTALWVSRDKERPGRKTGRKRAHELVAAVKPITAEQQSYTIKVLHSGETEIMKRVIKCCDAGTANRCMLVNLAKATEIVALYTGESQIISKRSKDKPDEGNITQAIGKANRMATIITRILTQTDGGALSTQTTRLPSRRAGLDSRWGRSRTFSRGIRAGLCSCLTSFLEDLPFLPPLHSCAAPYSPRFISISSEDLKSRRIIPTPRYTQHNVCNKIHVYHDYVPTITITLDIRTSITAVLTINSLHAHVNKGRTDSHLCGDVTTVIRHARRALAAI
ncbi:hypothetical protein PR048_019802 [Dryococelus australis]|uniref:Gustatory receptor n=1 Tax=Dryococelus australis TaxID=614101 RepID=A0ABQ9H4H9_9NEOP|nr:hypothetical protein PR048_019802 [Dryococelus australis]